MSTPDPRAGRVRGLRAAVLTVPVVGLTALAHGCPTLVGTLLLVGLVWPAAVALLGARRGLVPLLAWTAAAQLGGHLLLTTLCPDERAGASAAHLAAGLACAAVLGRADAGLWSARALLRLAARLRPPAALPPVTPRPVVRRVAGPPARLRSTAARDVARRRGPPVAA